MINYEKFYSELYPSQYDSSVNKFTANYKDFCNEVDLTEGNDSKLYTILLETSEVSDIDRKLLECRYDLTTKYTFKELSLKFKLSDSRIQQRLKSVERKLKHRKNVIKSLEKLIAEGDKHV